MILAGFEAFLGYVNKSLQIKLAAMAQLFVVLVVDIRIHFEWFSFTRSIHNPGSTKIIIDRSFANSLIIH